MSATIEGKNAMTPPARLTCLIENTSPSPNLNSEHGLALWLEVGDRCILFDTGRGPAFAENARSLGIPLSRAVISAISHGHYDHTGGLVRALAEAPDARVVAHAEIACERFRHNEDGSLKPIGMPADARRALENARQRWHIPQPGEEIAPGVHVTGTIPMRPSDPTTPFPHFLRGADASATDRFPDEQALIIKRPDGLVVITGCAHAGVLNTVRAAMDLAGGRPVRTLIGGLHLHRFSRPEIERIVAGLRELGVQRVSAGHCTGDVGINLLATEYGQQFQPLQTGTELQL